MNWIIKDWSDSLTSLIVRITMSSADVLDAQALDKMALNQWVGVMILSRGAPAVADPTAFSETVLSLKLQGRVRLWRKALGFTKVGN